MPKTSSRPTIPDVVRMFADYNAKAGNGAWGSLHAVMEDGNMADADIRSAIELARERDDGDAVVLGRILLTLSKTQRKVLPGAVERHVSLRTVDAP